MTIAQGVAKKLKYKKEVTWGTPPGQASGQLLRRVTSDISLNKNIFQSREIRSDYQVADYRHGGRSVGGTINGEMSLKTYADFVAAILRKAWADGPTTSSATVNSDAAAKTFTRTTGSYITDGVKVGDTVRPAGFTAGNVGMNGVNYRVTALSATVMTVGENTGMVTQSGATAITFDVVGKKVLVPSSAHTLDSFSIEHWYSDITQSELFTGCRVSEMRVTLPANDMASVAISFLGKDLASQADRGGVALTSEYFTAATAETTEATLAGVNGKLAISGTDVGVVTSADLTITANASTEPVIGQVYPPDVFLGRVLVSGNLSAFFENATLRDAFLNETEISLHLQLLAGQLSTSEFMSIYLPRLKVGGSGKDDGEKGIIQTIPFQALLNINSATNNADASTIIIQDSKM